MVSYLFFCQFAMVALVWLCVMLHWVWPNDPATACPTTLEPAPPLPERHREFRTNLAGRPNNKYLVHISSMQWKISGLPVAGIADHYKP